MFRRLHVISVKSEEIRVHIFQYRKGIENGESNVQFIISFSLMEAARVFSVGLCTIDVSSIAIGKLVNGRWRIIWGIEANHLILWICH